MSTTSPILLLSRSTMTRPSQPRAVSMLGVAMLGSFLVGYLSRALLTPSRRRRRRVLAAPRRRQPRQAPLPPAPLAGRDREVPVLAQPSGPPGLLVQRLGGMLDQFASDPALIMFRSALPAVLPDVGRSHLLVERLGGVLDRPAVTQPWWSSARLSGPSPLGRLAWPARQAGERLLRAEEGIQQAGVVRLRAQPPGPPGPAADL